MRPSFAFSAGMAEAIWSYRAPVAAQPVSKTSAAAPANFSKFLRNVTRAAVLLYVVPGAIPGFT